MKNDKKHYEKKANKQIIQNNENQFFFSNTEINL